VENAVNRFLRGVALLLIVVATVGALSRFVILPLHCARAASEASAAMEAGGERDDYRTRRVARWAHETLDGCDRTWPLDVRVPFAQGVASQGSGDPKTAVIEYERALAIDRRPEIYFALGLAQLDTLDRNGAIDSLVRACAFDPSRLAQISDEQLRNETQRRIVALYGSGL
jgi:tetratricopeptide (TPR) repeat protein